MTRKVFSSREELYLKWKHIMAVCSDKGKRNEGAPIDARWLTFEGFLEDNLTRFNKAKRKWKNYNNVTVAAKGIRTKINLVRKQKDKGYTKKNTVYTSPSDRMKFHKTANRYVFDNQKALLGTRDIKNLLKKKGIERSMSSIVATKAKGKALFTTNRLKKWKWKGCFMSLQQIAEKEKIILTQLANRVFSNKQSLKDAVKHCKDNPPENKAYSFRGEMLSATEIIRTLSKETGLMEGAITTRFYKWGTEDLDKLSVIKSNNKYAPYPKRIIAEKEGNKQEFVSIADAGRVLNINPSNISTYLNNDVNWKLKGFHFYRSVGKKNHV